VSAFRRGGTFYADFIDEHDRRRKVSLRRLDVKTKKQAEAVEAKLRARAEEIRHGIAVRERNPQALTVLGGLDWYLALPKVKKSANAKSLGYVLRKHLVGPLAQMRIELVRSGDVAAWLDEREAAAGLSPRSVNRLRAYLSGMFSRLIARDLLVGDNPCVRVERREEEDAAARLLPAEAIAVILDNAASPAWLLIFAFAVYAGMRRSEIKRLRRSDVDLERGTILIGKAKSRKARLVPIHPELRAIIERVGLTDVVVPRAAWGQAGAVTRAAMARGGFVVPAGVDACFHSLRHTFVTRAVDCGADPWAVEWITHGPPPSLRTMGSTYLKPIASLARELAKLTWPRPAKVLPIGEILSQIRPKARAKAKP